ncbi:MAG: Flp pilus assembly protein CpaB [Robiginitomaculum sp.]|nr:MAG: Flp pilus assembly protein CpaB [Robiginitomaculum sp.]
MFVRRNTIITLGASAAFGVLAILMARGFIDGAVNTQNAQLRANMASAPPAKAKLKTVPVIVADIRLMPGDPVTAQSVNIVQFPISSVPVGSFSAYEKLFIEPGNPAVALTQIVPGEPILAFKLSAPGGRASLSSVLADNMRAVAIRVNDVSGVAGFVRPEDRVDVVLTREIAPKTITRYGKKGEGSGRKPEFLAEILLQDVKVLAADQISHTGGNFNVNGGIDAPKLAKTITLEVSALQAQKLALAQSVGIMTLALRAPRSDERVNAKAMRTADLGGVQTKKRRTVRRTPVTRPAQVVVIRDDGQPRLVNVYRDQPKQRKLAGGAP